MPKVRFLSQSILGYFNRISCTSPSVKSAILPMPALHLSSKSLFRTFDLFLELKVFHVENLTMLI